MKHEGSRDKGKEGKQVQPVQQVGSSQPRLHRPWCPERVIKHREKGSSRSPKLRYAGPDRRIRVIRPNVPRIFRITRMLEGLNMVSGKNEGLTAFYLAESP